MRSLAALTVLLGGARADTCAEGSYATTNESAWGRACAGWAPCPVGHYCVDGARHACPAGTYGASEKETSSTCTATCKAGAYCPAGSSTETPCPAGTYCPAGSEAPTLVQMGFYADDQRTKEHRCPRGSYCIQAVSYTHLTLPTIYSV